MPLVHTINRINTYLAQNKKLEISIVLGLGVLWLFVQGWFWQSNQVRLVPDSTFRYVPYATEFSATGQLRGGHDDRYIAYILYLTFFFKTGLGLTAAVLGQVLLSGLATVCFFESVRRLTDNDLIVSFAATTLLICWKDIQYLNYYILTESLFISSIVFVFYFLIKAKSKKEYGIALLISIVTCTLRPNGFIVLLAALGYTVATYWPQLKKHQFKIVVSTLILGVSLLLLLDCFLLPTFDLIGTYVRGEVIYASDIYAVPVPKTLEIPPLHYSPLTRLYLFIAEQPVFFFKIFFSKLLLFITYAKPYYSVLHIGSIVVVIYGLYLFAVRYLISVDGSTPVKAFAIIIFALQAAIVAATSEDWDSRFLIPLLPVVMLVGFAGISQTIKHKQSKRSIIPPHPAAV